MILSHTLLTHSLHTHVAINRRINCCRTHMAEHCCIAWSSTSCASCCSPGENCSCSVAKIEENNYQIATAAAWLNSYLDKTKPQANHSTSVLKCLHHITLLKYNLVSFPQVLMPPLFVDLTVTGLRVVTLCISAICKLFDKNISH